MNPISLFSTIHFGEAFDCASDALGTSTAISIGGVPGVLEMPRLPDWGNNPTDPLHTPLIPPRSAEAWKQGDSPLQWGFPSEYPTGDSRVTKVLLHFRVPPESVNEAANKIHSNTGNWRAKFDEYFELITKQRRTQSIKVLNQPPDADLFLWGSDGKPQRPYEKSQSWVEIRMASRDSLLSREKLERICSLTSTERPLALEYRVQLQAYRALYQEDYRKAIIEAAVAAELALTNGLRRHFESERVLYGDKLLKKFRMLGGRLELAKVVGLELPICDLETTLIEPRNSVIHKATFVDESMATSAVDAVDELLESLCPSLTEQG